MTTREAVVGFKEEGDGFGSVFLLLACNLFSQGNIVLKRSRDRVWEISFFDYLLLEG